MVAALPAMHPTIRSVKMAMPHVRPAEKAIAHARHAEREAMTSRVNAHMAAALLMVMHPAIKSVKKAMPHVRPAEKVTAHAHRAKMTAETIKAGYLKSRAGTERPVKRSPTKGLTHLMMSRLPTMAMSRCHAYPAAERTIMPLKMRLCL